MTELTLTNCELIKINKGTYIDGKFSEGALEYVGKEETKYPSDAFWEALQKAENDRTLHLYAPNDAPFHFRHENVETNTDTWGFVGDYILFSPEKGICILRKSIFDFLFGTKSDNSLQVEN